MGSSSRPFPRQPACADHLPRAWHCSSCWGHSGERVGPKPSPLRGRRSRGGGRGDRVTGVPQYAAHQACKLLGELSQAWQPLWSPVLYPEKGLSDDARGCSTSSGSAAGGLLQVSWPRTYRVWACPFQMPERGRPAVRPPGSQPCLGGRFLPATDPSQA